jgi:hypothetical protein
VKALEATEAANIGKERSHLVQPFVSLSLNLMPKYTKAPNEVIIDITNMTSSETENIL